MFRGRRLHEAERVVRDAIERWPGDYPLTNLLGVILKNRNQPGPALEALEAAHRLAPDRAAPLSNIVNLHLTRRDGPSAVAAAKRLLAGHPASPEAHRQLGTAAALTGDYALARQGADRAAELDPADVQPWIDGAQYREQAGDVPAALTRLETAAAIDPVQAGRARAATLRRTGRLADAIAWLEAEHATDPERPWVLLELARCCRVSQPDRAIEHLRAALALASDDPDILMELADSLDRMRGAAEGENIQEAYALAKRRIALGRVRARDIQVLRNILHRNGDHAAAAALGSFERLGAYWAETGQITALHYHLSKAATPAHRALLVRWHRHWGRGVDAEASRRPLDPLPRPAVRSGPAKIRIGFMSSDLRRHPVAYFALPVIEGFDRSRFELYCYSWNTGPADPVQDHIGKRATAFRLAPGLTDRDSAALIAKDGLDLLFELGGTTHMNKLRVMSWRPARIQASWLGYPHSAGPASIDHILVDPHLRPPDPALLIEKPFELARSWVVLGRLGFRDDEPLDPATPEARTSRVTFGTMNNPYKYTPALLETWAAILRAVPNSRFLFVRPEGASAPFRTHIQAAFERGGVEPGRVDFVPVRGAHLKHYNDIDIALDTFPHTGGTTTCEALWMGVPTVTLVGPAFFERLSYSNLMNAGLPNLCCFDVPGYVAAATELAADQPFRAQLRTTIRRQLRKMPLGRPDWFVRDFQDAVMRTMEAHAGRARPA